MFSGQRYTTGALGFSARDREDAPAGKGNPTIPATGPTLYIDADSSKEYGMALMAYHVKENPEPVMMDSDVPEGYDDDQ